MEPRVITELDAVPMISIEDCRKHLRIDPDDSSPPIHPDDDTILMYLGAAREWVEGYTGLALTPRTLELALDAFPTSDILLPWSPLQSITSVKYVNTDEDVVRETVDAAAYLLDNRQQPGWLMVVDSWPDTASVINAVYVQYVVGFSLYSDEEQTYPLPKLLRSAVLLILTDLYENRTNSDVLKLTEVPIGAKSLCDFVRVRLGMA